MAATVQQLIWILQLFFPPELAAQQAIYVLGVVISLYPIVRLHLNQMNEARRQSPLTAWMRSIQTLLTRAFHEEANNVQAWATGINLAEEYSAYLCRDLHRLYTLLGLTDEMADPASFLFRPARRILCTPRLNCKFCPAADRNLVPSLRRRSKGKDRHYYPDMITRKAAGRGQKRSQVLEYEPEFLRCQNLEFGFIVQVLPSPCLHFLPAAWFWSRPVFRKHVFKLVYPSQAYPSTSSSRGSISQAYIPGLQVCASSRCPVIKSMPILL
ncbi:hypothetical protein B0H14DRAFT_2582881 [Mycena olivaceomarginata]|nr:hypothetical protein B0H14DRAFT_2582881 [Mycena olivaceomarginata]